MRASVKSRPQAEKGRERPPLPRWAWARLAACTAAAALLQLDGTLITVALPSVARGLHVSSTSTSAVLSAYFGAYALMLLPGGALVDRFDARRVALAGLALFGVGAAAGAIAPTLGVVVATRVLQGAGAGLVSPAALAGAVSGFPAQRRGSALGIWGASAGLSNLVGPLLGGLLTVVLGWRADWWALVPLTLLAAGAIVRILPASIHSDAAGKTQPVVNPVVLAATLVAGVTFAVMIGCFYLAEQYLQLAAGYSALGASSVLIVVAVLVGAAAPLELHPGRSPWPHRGTSVLGTAAGRRRWRWTRRPRAVRWRRRRDGSSCSTCRRSGMRRNRDSRRGPAGSGGQCDLRARAGARPMTHRPTDGHPHNRRA